jgi:HEAT repeat protein
LRRLESQGIREDRARATLDELGVHLFRPDRLIVLAHLDRAAIDELVPLDVFPPVDRTVRVATVILSGIDPSLSDQAEQLVTQLGDPSASVRESAERDLQTLGPVAIPALNTALEHQDLEIVYRAERVLRQLNQPIP